MTELMGDGCIPADLQRLRLTNVSPESLLKTAFANMPQVPGFPSLSKFTYFAFQFSDSFV